jgi:anti-sigma regulatory factor (Ser/Thr protein kinase)
MDRPARGRQQRSDSGIQAAILGAVTVPGEPEQVSRARGFVARTLTEAGLPRVDSDAATLLTSELVTNAVLHTDSGKPGGMVSVVVLGLPDGVLVEVTDGGSASAPVVKADALAGEGQGLYLVQQMASQWGYRRDLAGTTVWFHLVTEPPVTGGTGPSGSLHEGAHPAGHHPGGQYHAGQQHGDPWYPDRQQRAASTIPAQIIARSSSLTR